MYIACTVNVDDLFVLTQDGFGGRSRKCSQRPKRGERSRLGPIPGWGRSRIAGAV
jgi:hypothetical protein